MECDVINVPHRKEYYKKTHIQHFITLIDFNESTGTWTALDDLTNGELVEFIFPDKYIEMLFDSNFNKIIRVFEKSNKSATNFIPNKITSSQMSNFLDDINKIVNFDKKTLEAIRESLILFVGSRQCYYYFLSKNNSQSLSKHCLDIVEFTTPILDKLKLSLVMNKFNKNEIIDSLKMIENRDFNFREKVLIG
jgi:hypothetical protein